MFELSWLLFAHFCQNIAVDWLANCEKYNIYRKSINLGNI